MKFYSLDIEETLKKLSSNKDGLSNEEVQKRLKKDGKNKIIEIKNEKNIIINGIILNCMLKRSNERLFDSKMCKRR